MKGSITDTGRHSVRQANYPRPFFRTGKSYLWGEQLNKPRICPILEALTEFSEILVIDGS